MTGPIVITGVPISSLSEVLQQSNVSSVTVSDTFQNLDYTILLNYGAFITAVSITPSIQATVSDITTYTDLIKLNTTSVIINDTAANIAAQYSFIQTNFPNASIEADAPFLLPTPVLTLNASTATTLSFSYSDVKETGIAYDTFTYQLTKTVSNTLCDNTVTDLTPATSSDFTLTITGSKGLVRSTTQSFSTRLLLTQEADSLVFTYASALAAPSLVSDGVVYPLVNDGITYTHTMQSSTLVTQLKEFSLFDGTVLLFKTVPLTVTAFDVPVPSFHFTNVSYQTFTVVFDFIDNAINDSYTVDVLDDDTGFALFSNQTTSSVDVFGYAAGQTVNINVTIKGNSGKSRSLVQTQVTQAIDTLQVTQQGATLSFSWAGSLLNPYVSLSGLTIASSTSTSIQYEMPDNSFVNNASIFTLHGTPEIGESNRGLGQISTPFSSFTVVPFHVPTPSFYVTYNNGATLVFDTTVATKDDSFTYMVQTSTGLHENVTSFLIGANTSFSVSAIGSSQTKSVSVIVTTAANIPTTESLVFVVDTAANIQAAVIPLTVYQIVSTTGTITLTAQKAVDYGSRIRTPIIVDDTATALSQLLPILATLTIESVRTTSMVVSASTFSSFRLLLSVFTPLCTVSDSAASIATYFSDLYPTLAIQSTGPVKVTVSQFLSNPNSSLAEIEIEDAAQTIAENILYLETFSSITNFTSTDGVAFNVPTPSFTISNVSATSADVTIDVPVSGNYDRFGFSIYNATTLVTYLNTATPGLYTLTELDQDTAYPLAVKTIGLLKLERVAPTQTIERDISFTVMQENAVLKFIIAGEINNPIIKDSNNNVLSVTRLLNTLTYTIQESYINVLQQFSLFDSNTLKSVESFTPHPFISIIQRNNTLVFSINGTSNAVIANDDSDENSSFFTEQVDASTYTYTFRSNSDAPMYIGISRTFYLKNNGTIIDSLPFTSKPFFDVVQNDNVLTFTITGTVANVIIKYQNTVLVVYKNVNTYRFIMPDTFAGTKTFTLYDDTTELSSATFLVEQFVQPRFTILQTDSLLFFTLPLNFSGTPTILASGNELSLTTSDPLIYTYEMTNYEFVNPTTFILYYIASIQFTATPFTTFTISQDSNILIFRIIGATNPSVYTSGNMISITQSSQDPFVYFHTMVDYSYGIQEFTVYDGETFFKNASILIETGQVVDVPFPVISIPFTYTNSAVLRIERSPGIYAAHSYTINVNEVLYASNIQIGDVHIENLTPNTEYAIQVVAVGSAMTKSSSIIVQTLSLTIPVPQISNSFSYTTSIVVRIETVPGTHAPHSYSLYFDGSIYASNLQAGDVLIENLTPDTAYDIQVDAIGSELTESASISVRTMTLTTDVPVPEISNPTSSTNSLVVRIALKIGAYDAYSYTLFVNRVVYESNLQAGDVLIENLTPDTAYDIQVDAIGSELTESASISVRTLTADVPVPQLSNPTSSTNSLVVRISAVSGTYDVHSYILFVNGTLYASDLQAGDVLIENLTPDTIYEIYVISYGSMAAKNSFFSVRTLSLTEVPTPQISTLTSYTNSVVLRIAAAVGAYATYSYTINVNGTLYSSNLQAGDVQIQNLTPNTEYAIQVVAVGSSMTKSSSISVRTLSLITDVPVPAISNPTSSTKSVVVRIAAVSGTYAAHSYTLYVNGNLYASSLQPGDVLVQNLTPNTEYTIQVTAVGQSTQSSSISVRTLILSRICFPKNTLVECDQGAVAIQDLKAGLHTFGGIELEAITKTISDERTLIEFSPNAFEMGVPNATLRTSNNHQIMWHNAMMKAAWLEQGNQVPYNGEVLYNILLKDVYGLIAIQGIPCETLYPSNSIAKVYRQILRIERPIANSYELIDLRKHT